eukprot:scaffold48_cov311-Pinguiococcus_pyrenoidosus.AAC.86
MVFPAVQTQEGEAAPVGAPVAILVPSPDMVGQTSAPAAPVAAAAAPAPGAAAPAPAAAGKPDVPSAEVFMPALSSTMTEGKIVEWSKSVGDAIDVGETLMVVESDKADMDVEAFEAGYLAAILVQEGDAAPVGAPVGIVVASESDIGKIQDWVSSGGQAQAGAAAAPAPAAAAPGKTSSAALAPRGTSATHISPASLQPRRQSPQMELRLRLPEEGWSRLDSPSRKPQPRWQRRSKARCECSGSRILPSFAQGVDLSTVAGSGPGGRVVAADVANAPAGTASTCSAPPFDSWPFGKAIQIRSPLTRDLNGSHRHDSDSEQVPQRARHGHANREGSCEEEEHPSRVYPRKRTVRSYPARRRADRGGREAGCGREAGGPGEEQGSACGKGRGAESRACCGIGPSGWHAESGRQEHGGDARSARLPRVSHHLHGCL